MNIQIKRIENTPVPSNSYIISFEGSGKCIVIDPGAKECKELISYMDENHLKPEYIFLTHEHFDHIWGCNVLIDKYESKLICSKKCAEKIAVPQNYYNRLYYDKDEFYSVSRVFDTTDSYEKGLVFNNVVFRFWNTPGHSSCSICIAFNDYLLTGDTLMNGYKPLILKRHEGSVDKFHQSVKWIFENFPKDTVVLPGHGDSFYLKDVYDYYAMYFRKYELSLLKTV